MCYIHTYVENIGKETWGKYVNRKRAEIWGSGLFNFTQLTTGCGKILRSQWCWASTKAVSAFSNEWNLNGKTCPWLLKMWPWVKLHYRTPRDFLPFCFYSRHANGRWNTCYPRSLWNDSLFLQLKDSAKSMPSKEEWHHNCLCVMTDWHWGWFFMWSERTQGMACREILEFIFPSSALRSMRQEQIHINKGKNDKFIHNEL